MSILSQVKLTLNTILELLVKNIKNTDIDKLTSLISETFDSMKIPVFRSNKYQKIINY